jgi:formate transporter
MYPDGHSFDALLPPQMAAKAEQVGIKKAHADAGTLLVLSVLAGAFIALGAIFATVAGAGAKEALPFGVAKLLAGLSFSVGLILVLVGGAELFTGNTLIIMAFASGKVSLAALLRNWALVYAGNFVGALATAAIIFVAGQHTFGGGAVGANMLAIAEAKSSLGFAQAVALGILCNATVCMAVWLSYSAHTTADKILAVIPPVAGFVAAGFEHSVANMYFIPVALLVRSGADAAFWEQIGHSPADFPHLTWGNFLAANLLPVTIGNIIGGAAFVGLVYWFVYLRPSPEPRQAARSSELLAADSPEHHARAR